jgi:hypothetical protein
VGGVGEISRLELELGNIYLGRTVCRGIDILIMILLPPEPPTAPGGRKEDI